MEQDEFRLKNHKIKLNWIWIESWCWNGSSWYLMYKWFRVLHCSSSSWQMHWNIWLYANFGRHCLHRIYSHSIIIKNNLHLYCFLIYHFSIELLTPKCTSWNPTRWSVCKQLSCKLTVVSGKWLLVIRAFNRIVKVYGITLFHIAIFTSKGMA